MYEQLNQLFGTSTLSNDSIPPTQKFEECYKLLRHKTLSQSVVDGLLRNAWIKNDQITIADLCLARVVDSLKQFETIISTYPDPLLENTLDFIGWKELKDYEVHTAPAAPPSRRTVPCRIIKIYGSLTNNDYVIQRSGYLAGQHNLLNFLQTQLKQDCLLIGLDPVWDKELIDAIPLDGEPLWYINEEKLDENASLKQARRTVIEYTNDYGSYEQFCQRLHWHIFGVIPFNLSDKTSQLLFEHISQLKKEVEKLHLTVEKLAQQQQVLFPHMNNDQKV